MRAAICGLSSLVRLAAPGVLIWGPGRGCAEGRVNSVMATAYIDQSMDDVDQ